MPAQTHVATAHSVEYTGAKAIFADIDFETGNISINEIVKNYDKKKPLYPYNGREIMYMKPIKIAKK